MKVKMNKFDIKKVSGKAIVTDEGYTYPRYSAFANAAEHPDAVHNRLIRNGEEVSLLARGKHGSDSYELYVVVTKDNRKAIIGSKGLDIKCEMSEITYDAAIESLRQAAYAEGYAQGKFDTEMKMTEKLGTDETKKPKETVQEKRDVIIEQAKRDIVNLGDKGIYTIPKENAIHGTFDDNGAVYATCHVEFVINKKKRTVVALLRGVCTKTIYSRGIAKCLPSDYFNEHVGKAIALRRALGLEVPEEYLNTPQPREVRVGNIIEVYLKGGNKFKTFKAEATKGNRLYLDKELFRFCEFKPEYGDRVIDDTDEEEMIANESTVNQRAIK